jgi:hypothetical protein
MKITWNEYKNIASDNIEKDISYIYRGQSDSNWTLISSLVRTGMVQSLGDFQAYFNLVLPQVKEKIQAWEGRDWNLADQLGLAEFVAYLQHNGFPTPLLDWTLSPYVAAYFAFEGVDPFNAKSESVSIYCFNAGAWRNKFKQENNIAHEPSHVSLLHPRIVGNHKLALQQGCFTFSNVIDVEVHIRDCETEADHFLDKYILKADERPKVMKELSLMGISAVQLMPSIESVCKKALNDLIGLSPIRRLP